MSVLKAFVLMCCVSYTVAGIAPTEVIKFLFLIRYNFYESFYFSLKFFCDNKIWHSRCSIHKSLSCSLSSNNKITISAMLYIDYNNIDREKDAYIYVREEEKRKKLFNSVCEQYPSKHFVIVKQFFQL